jgi:hypothetical protein
LDLRAPPLFQGHFEIKMVAEIWKNRLGKIAYYFAALVCSTTQKPHLIQEIKFLVNNVLNT